jgi:hypothetical protein
MTVGFVVVALKRAGFVRGLTYLKYLIRVRVGVKG